jgi:hypothetical protein
MNITQQALNQKKKTVTSILKVRVKFRFMLEHEA